MIHGLQIWTSARRGKADCGPIPSRAGAAPRRVARVPFRVILRQAWQAGAHRLTAALPADRRPTPPSAFSRRGAGVVERGGLENRCALTGTEGSNPSLSAT